MASLTAQSAYFGTLPVSHGGVTLSEVEFDAITWVSPFAGQGPTVSAALEKAIDAPFPEPNRMTGQDGTHLVWFGPDQALALGPTFDPIKGAAMSEQSGAWASCALEGAKAEAVLARLVPIDLRLGVFEPGHAARTMLGHMNCVLIRTGTEKFLIMVFRSMAETCVHEIERAMRMVAARATV